MADRRRSARSAEPPLARDRVALARSIVQAGYRALAMKAHPDHGGSAADMAALTRMRDELLTAIGQWMGEAKPPPAPAPPPPPRRGATVVHVFHGGPFFHGGHFHIDGRGVTWKPGP